MKLKEAKEIVKCILDWQFVLMGVKERKEITSTIVVEKYSLEDLIKANRLVESNNSRKSKLAKYHRDKGHKANGYSISMMLDDRLIAAAYTALHFFPNGEAIVLINDIGVGCVEMKYTNDEQS